MAEDSSCMAGIGRCSLFLSFFIVLFITMIVSPQAVKIAITDAHLTQFNYTNSTLYYNLAFNLTIRNPNKRLGISYRRIRVIARYRKKRFALVTLPNSTVPFYQGHKNTTHLSDVIVQGQQVLKFGKKEISMFDEETAAGNYSIEAVLGLRVKLRLGTFKFHNCGLRSSHCRLKLHILDTNNTTASSGETDGGFTVTKCGHVSLSNCFFLSWFS